MLFFDRTRTSFKGVKSCSLFVSLSCYSCWNSNLPPSAATNKRCFNAAKKHWSHPVSSSKQKRAAPLIHDEIITVGNFQEIASVRELLSNCLHAPLLGRSLWHYRPITSTGTSEENCQRRISMPDIR